MSTDKLKISIKKMNLVTNWEFNSPTKECTLCRNLLVAPSPQELNNKTPYKSLVIDGKIVVGDCKHMFHKTCLDLFMKDGCMLCPTDKTSWKTAKTIKSGVTYENNSQLVLKSKS